MPSIVSGKTGTFHIVRAELVAKDGGPAPTVCGSPWRPAFGVRRLKAAYIARLPGLCGTCLRRAWAPYVPH